MDRSRLGTLKDCAPRKRTTLVSHCSRGTSILETTIWLEKSYSPGHSPAHLGLLVPHFGFRVLAGAEDSTGILPCGNTKADRLGRLQGEERVRYAFGTAYHTAYVMGFLCAASLRPNRGSAC